MRYRMYASRVCVVSARAVAFHLAVWAGHALSALRVRDPVARRTETFRFSRPCRREKAFARQEKTTKATTRFATSYFTRAPARRLQPLPTPSPKHAPRCHQLPRRRAPAHARARRAQVRHPRRDHDPRLERRDGTRPPSRETRGAPDLFSSFATRARRARARRASRRVENRLSSVECDDGFARLPDVSVLDANGVVVAFVLSDRHRAESRSRSASRKTEI